MGNNNGCVQSSSPVAPSSTAVLPRTAPYLQWSMQLALATSCNTGRWAYMSTQTTCSSSGHRPSQYTLSLLKRAQAVMQDLQSGEINFMRQSKICQAPITAFDVSADGALLGVGTSEGQHLSWQYLASASRCVADSFSICECAAVSLLIYHVVPHAGRFPHSCCSFPGASPQFHMGGQATVCPGLKAVLVHGGSLPARPECWILPHAEFTLCAVQVISRW